MGGQWRVFYGMHDSDVWPPDLNDQEWSIFDETFPTWDEAVQWGEAVLQPFAVELDYCEDCRDANRTIIAAFREVVPDTEVAFETAEGNQLWIVRAASVSVSP